jgi:GxxExxY protein
MAAYGPRHGPQSAPLPQQLGPQPETTGAVRNAEQQGTKDRDRPAERTDAIIEAATEVRRQLGSRLSVDAYERAMALELFARDVPFHGAMEEPVYYKGQKLDVSSRAGFICFGTIVVELTAVAKLTGGEESRTADYLKTAGCKHGLLMNFGAQALEHRVLASQPERDGDSNPHTWMAGL